MDRDYHIEGVERDIERRFVGRETLRHSPRETGYDAGGNDAEAPREHDPDQQGDLAEVESVRVPAAFK
ncbi:MAG TPA: hypothetical protein VFA84_01540 [Acidimicrobiales bacterium]|nr:hypothetical protein [Acidimicrobiales bacterium]